jgi:hypothetical protein
VPNTVDSSELIAAKKEQVSKKDVETEAPAFQKEKDDAVDTRPSDGVPRSFDMDHYCSAVTLDNDDPSLYIGLKGAYYQFRDVPGDGNCLFHALAKIPALPFSSAQEVRNTVVSYVLHGQAGDYRLKPTAARTLQRCTQSFYKEDVECWAERMKECGTERKHWGTTWEATIVAYMCGIEIIVLTNLHSGFEKVSSKETLRMWASQGMEPSLCQEAVNEAFWTQNMRAWFKTHPLLFLVQCAATLVTVTNTFRLGHCDCRKSQNDERERTCVVWCVFVFCVRARKKWTLMHYLCPILSCHY